MIKITKFFYINWLVFPLFLGAYFAGAINALVLSYCVVAVHELFHLFASVILNVRVKSIIMMPFGMTLRLEQSIIKNPLKEMIIAFCGPLSNMIMALSGVFCYAVYGSSYGLLFFITINVLIGILNLLPAMPLDGGRIVRAFLVEKIGFLGAVSITKKLTRIVAVLISLAGLFVLYISKMNISLVMIGSFILLSMISDGKNNEYIIMKDILYSGNKIKKSSIMKTKLIAAGREVRLGELVKRFDYSSFHLIGVIDEKNQVSKVLTECEVVDMVVKNSSTSTVSEI